MTAKAGLAPGKLESALGRLYARVPLGMRLGLDAMHAACARAGHPERAFDAVHIAGTNGKGSTCAMVESIARAAGKKTGLYTSPHLCRFAERIRIDGKPIDDEALVRVLEQALDLGSELSFFETATLAAFLAFREAKVDLAVVEVGIGGRLDATNVFDSPSPLCCAVTSVGLDHTDKLGSTLDAIAREKAAIAKRGRPLVVGAMPAVARRAVIDVALAVGARVIDADLGSSIPNQSSPDVTVSLERAHERDDAPGAPDAHEERAPATRAASVLPLDAMVALEGAHQRANAAVAWAVAAELGIDEATRARGLATARWPGRLQRIAPCAVEDADLMGPWIVDGAHNPDGIAALVRSLEGKTIGAVVFGVLEDKAWPRMLEELGAIAAPRVFVSPSSGRNAIDPRDLAMNDPSSARREVAFTVRQGLVLAREIAGRDLVVVCGSLHLVGEVFSLILGSPRDPPVAL